MRSTPASVAEVPLLWTAALTLVVLALGLALASAAATDAGDRLAALGVDPAARHALVRLVRGVVGLAAVLTALGILGVPAWEAVLAVAAVGIAAGVVLRGPIEQLAAGAMLRSAGTHRPGDHVRIGDLTGRVREIGPWTTTVEQADGAVLSVSHTDALRRGVARVGSIL